MRSVLLSLIIVLLSAGAVLGEEIPDSGAGSITNFTSGSIISSTDMNTNFDNVETAVDDNATDIDILDLAVGALGTTNSTQDGLIIQNQNDIVTLQAGNVASGQQALPTTAISGNSCLALSPVAATGVTTSDVISVGFSEDPTVVTGYGPGATDGLAIYAYPTAGNVNFKVCNLTSSAITPGALTVNWRVSR